MSRRLNSDTAPWKPTTGFGAAGATVGTGAAGLERPPVGIGLWLAVSMATGNAETQGQCQ